MLAAAAFNGGNDVWVDVGNKHIGVETLQAVCWHCIYLLCQHRSNRSMPMLRITLILVSICCKTTAVPEG